MKAVTSKYYIRRKHKTDPMLPWHLRNEQRNYGYLTVSMYDGWSRRFSVSDWLGWDADTRKRREAYDPLRYSDLYEGIRWNHVMHPWEIVDEEQKWMIPQFSSIEEKMKYIDKIFDNIKCDRCGVMYPPVWRPSDILGM